MEIIDEISRDYKKFMNFLMSYVYSALFQYRIPRALPQMRETLKFYPEKIIKDSFLSEHRKVIALYGFWHQPFVLPAFFTLRVYALELIKKRLIVENEHFMNFRKSSNIKFP